ncbi:hypothetical protein SDJN03_06296, partial [Cucurbita argyrosperma subsp. sororia]
MCTHKGIGFNFKPSAAITKRRRFVLDFRFPPLLPASLHQNFSFVSSRNSILPPIFSEELLLLPFQLCRGLCLGNPR